MEFNDLLIPANEKIDTNILDRTLKKTMTLYHGTDKELTVISPTSINVGNRLSPIHRKSSFWTKDFDYAVVWALDWVAMRSNLSYFHDIENLLSLHCNFKEKEIQKYIGQKNGCLFH